MKGNGNLEKLVFGMEEGLYAKVLKVLKERRRAINPGHLVLLRHIRQHGEGDEEPKGISEGYRARLRQFRHELYIMVCSALLESSDVAAMGRSMRHELEVALMLRHLGHLDMCIEWLQRAKRSAASAYDHLFHLECLDNERIVLKDMAGTAALQEDNRAAIRATLSTLQVVAELRLMADEMLHIIRNHGARPGSPAYLRAQEMAKHEFLHEEGGDTSFRSRAYRLSFLFMYHKWLGEMDIAQRLAEEQLTLWDLHPEMVSHMPHAYISAVGNALTHALVLGQTHRWEELRPRFEHSALRSEARRAEMFRTIEMAYLLHRLQRHDFEGVAADRPRLLRELERFEKHLPPSFIMAMKSNLGMHAWLMDDRRTARRILLDVMDGPHRLSRPEAMYMATLVIALMDFDKGLMESEDIRRLRKKLAQYPKADALTALVMSQLPQLTQHARGAEREQRQQLARTKLAEWARTHRGVPGTDEYCLWLLHRCTGRPMLDLYLEKAHHRLLGIE